MSSLLDNIIVLFIHFSLIRHVHPKKILHYIPNTSYVPRMSRHRYSCRFFSSKINTLPFTGLLVFGSTMMMYSGWLNHWKMLNSMNCGYDRIDIHPHHSYDHGQAQIPVLTFSINRITRQQACITNSWPVISERENDSECVDNRFSVITVNNTKKKKKITKALLNVHGSWFVHFTPQHENTGWNIAAGR